jgi:aspartyl-tRNA(Asn)/glutamyl-tRNA(Gln) amidotransferase subunit A
VADIATLTATALSEHYQSRTLSPVEAVAACIAEIEHHEPQINAIVTPVFEHATEAAKKSTERWMTGTQRSPLDGVPYGLKDIIATEGVLTTGGSSLYKDNVPSVDAVLASRLADAGAVLLAKLQTFEFACGGVANNTFGPVHNPWDLSRTTGGSSSGSSAAVAAGMLPFAIGSDTGGSIRGPAAYCGISGLKPTYGRVPRTGVMGLSWTLDHVGPMARSVRDIAGVLSVIAGHHGSDPYASKRSVPDYDASLMTDVAGMRIGRATGYFRSRVHPGVLAACDTALAVLESLGAVVVDVEVPLAHLADVATWIIVYAEMASLHEPHLADIENRDEMGAVLLSLGQFVTASEYLRSLRFRAMFQQSVETAFADIDVLATPGTGTVAPRLDEMLADIGDEQVDWVEVAARNSTPFNLTGQPALCVPCGLVDGLPASLQLVGRPHDESSVLALGAAYQRETTHHLVSPTARGAPAAHLL